MSQGGEAITESSNTALAIIIAERSAFALVTALAALSPPRFLCFSCCATRYPYSASSGRRLSKALPLMYRREMKSGPVSGAGLLEKKRPQWMQRFVQEMRCRRPQWVRQRHLGRGLGRKGTGGVGGVVVGVGVDGSGGDEGDEVDEGPDNVDDDDGDGDVVAICTAISSGSAGGGGSGESGGVINDGPRWLDSFAWRWSAILRPLPLHLGNVWRWFDLVACPNSAMCKPYSKIDLDLVECE
ncbi:uncharacterized protein CLUP02_02247 [Colletotrichum lupini]|uniref:Uncharacterized protein n=1 Tax=Colletotrichum lupini TaxID=145971 RepID=A0A9Q8WA23_9PEZI|nr:uncharacterized protein CLUP02_02247 [Colletotrichum lupini]UQC75591.1 hypothetical protein CLUP02_02247 [Colletotrichum lupini]